MDAGQLFKNGQLAEAIDAQLALVKSKPTDHGQRMFLFELLVFAGDLDRAERQINAVQYSELELDAAVMEYRKNLAAERLRRQVFAGKAQPEFLGPVTEPVRLRLLGLVKLAAGAPTEAAAAFQQANEQIPPIHGTLNDKPFDSLRDGDDCLGSVLEVFAQGKYFWVPLEEVGSVAMNAPRFPRDLMWIPAHLELQKGDAGAVFLPALYAGTEQATDVQLKLGRMTEWRGDTLVRGVGMKEFFVGSEPTSILDWRNLVVTAEPGS
jgi:type VI secretion system protein ImpE